MNNNIFIPIDVGLTPVDLKSLSQQFSNFGFLHYTGLWNVLPVIAKVEDNYQALDMKLLQKKAWMLRYRNNGPQPRWLFDFDKIFPNLKKTIDKLPFKVVTHCNILSQIKDIPPHFDVDNRYKESTRNDMNQLEPLSYKIMLSDTAVKSFYVCNSKEEKVYITLPNNVNTFAINENSAKHGASLIRNNTKFICSIFGILDEDRHIDLIKHSQIKYRSFCIAK